MTPALAMVEPDGSLQVPTQGAVQSECDVEFVFSKAVLLPACSDGQDNDGDGLIDLDDPDCSSATDPLEAPDADDDAIADAYDNCPDAPNPLQEDVGGIGPGSASDGIGDACQCGDVNGDGFVTGLDGTLVTRAALNLAPFSGGVGDLAAPEKCDVGGTAGCTGLDGTLIKRASLGLAPGVQQNCAAAQHQP